ncbi:MAG TPA: acyltransferase [Pyrinomonadaceae bacterium]|nr:acyltransferase [Pyrinomonadaceae bacterium]
MPAPAFHLGYRPELDGIRGISILLVLGLHFTPKLIPGGFLGVEVFFVLSGFLITSLLLQEWAGRGSISLKDFYLRRALRLGPALLFYLLALTAYAFFIMKGENAFEVYKGVLLTLSYVSNWVIALKPDFPISILAITWSLAVEEQFYLLWPLTLFLLLIKGARLHWIIVLLLTGIFVVIIHRLFLFYSGASFHRLYYATDTRADGLLWGCLLACLVSWNRLTTGRTKEWVLKSLALISMALLSYMVFTLKSSNPNLFKGEFSLATFAIAIILTVIVLWPASLAVLLLRFPPLVWIGRVSYGLYLWHWPVRGLVFRANTNPSIARIAAAVALSFAITTFSYYVVERPFLMRKKRLAHAGSRA